MKYLNKKTLAITLLASQSLMADELAEDASIHPHHPHATSTDNMSKPDGITQMEKVNYMLHQHTEEVSSLGEELFLDAGE